MRSLLPGSRPKEGNIPLHIISGPRLPPFPSEEVLALMEVLERPNHPLPLLRVLSNPLGVESICLVKDGATDQENWDLFSALKYLQVSSVGIKKVEVSREDLRIHRDFWANLQLLAVRVPGPAREEEEEEPYLPEEEEQEEPEEPEEAPEP